MDAADYLVETTEALSKQLASLERSSPEPNRLVEGILRTLLSFYETESGFLLLRITNLDLALYTLTRGDLSIRGLRVREPSQVPLINTTDEAIAFYGEDLDHAEPVSLVLDSKVGDFIRAPNPEEATVVADLLSIASFITVPVKHGNSIIGRLFLGDTRPFALDTTDVSVLQQVAKHISALVQPLDVHAVLLFNTEPELSLTGEKTISGDRSQHEEALTLLRRWVSRAIRYVSSARRDKSVDKGMRDSPFRRS